MQIQQIRNGTNKIIYGDTTFLLDPYLGEKGALGTLGDISGQPYKTPDPVKMQLPMPFYPLPDPIGTILEHVDYYLFTSLAPDHIDRTADGTVGALLDHKIPALVQNETDAALLRKSGFADVRVVSEDGTELGEITLVKTATCHGKIIPTGDAMGVVLLKEGEKALYVAGDTIWYEEVRQVLQDFKPRVVMVNGCAATLLGCGRLSMDDEDIESVSRNLPDAVVYVTHMDNDAAACITRHEMRGRLTNRGVTSYIMPRDGQTIHF